MKMLERKEITISTVFGEYVSLPNHPVCVQFTIKLCA